MGPKKMTLISRAMLTVFAEIVQCLDNRSLTLVMRDAKDDGRKPIEILREHYVGEGKPRVIALYTELTSLKMSEDCGLTDYVLEAETAAMSVKSAGEEISDSLLVAMVLKGLPTQYNTFKTVVTQRERKMSFTEFKVALRSFEETEKCQQPSASGVIDRVMTAQPTQQTRSNSSAGRAAPTNPSVITCYACGKIGHKSYDCRLGKTTKRCCANCKSATHDTAYCRRKKDSVNQMLDTCDNMDKCDDNQGSKFVVFW